jgi:glycolate oxidase iron-sulfur subunit
MTESVIQQRVSAPERRVASDDLANRLAADTDTCVACGMCLPVCPTYVETRSEAESPRGRISLIQGLVRGRLDGSAKLVEHLDHCLACRACESVCPAKVPYGRIIEGARAYLHEHRLGAESESRTEKLLAWTVRKPRRLHAAGRLFSLYQHTGLPRVLRWAYKDLGEVDKALPTIPFRFKWREFYPAVGPEQGRVALFVGCVADLVDRETLRAGIEVITMLGYGVHVPRGQTCCGAIDAHAGNRAHSIQLAQANVGAFRGLEVDAIISMTSGCGAHLSGYRDWAGVGDDREGAARDFANRVKDISQFLVEARWPETITVLPCRERVAVHSPCSLRNVLRQERAPVELLQRIPDIRLIPLDPSVQCCGAAGTYMVKYPETANRLRAAVLNQVQEVGAATLVTSNIGCAMHLALGNEASDGIREVLHPITLLRRHLTREGN